MEEEKTLFEKIYEAGEEQLTRFAKEVISHPTFSAALEKALRNAAATKGKVDRNVDTLLGLFNIPSKSDYNKLLAKVEAVQGSLVNLNIKLDRLLATGVFAKKAERTSRRKAKPSHPSRNPKGSGPSSG
jgi:hypothetical protein